MNKAPGAFARESLELLYYAFFLPSRLQARMNAWLPPGKIRTRRPRPANTTPYAILTHWREPLARRFLAQCAPWWILGLIPMWIWGRSTLSLWWLISLSALLPTLGWGVALLDIPSGLLAPLWMGLAWASSPTVMQNIQASVSQLGPSFEPWLAWRSGGLLLAGSLIVGFLGGGEGRWLRAKTGSDGWLILGVLVSLVAAFVLLAVVYNNILDQDTSSEMAIDDVAFVVAFAVALGVAGVVAFVVAFGVAFGVVGIVAFGVEVFEAGGVADVVAFFVAYGVAGVVASILAYGVAGIVAGGMFAAILGLIDIAPGLASLLWWSVAWGVSGLGTTWGLSTTRKVSGMLFVLAGLTVFAGVEQGIAAAAGAFRLWSSLAAAVAGMVAYLWSGLRPTSTLRLLPMVPPFSDEIVWTPVPFLERLLVRAFTENPQAGLEAIRTVAGSLRQGGAARRALMGITVYTLQNYGDLKAIAGTESRVTWLPGDLEPLGRDVSEIVPRLFQVSKSVAVALDSESPYNRRLGLSGAADDLTTLRQNLPFLGRRAAGRWMPVVERWRRLLATELERPLAQAESKEIPNPYEAGNPLRVNRSVLFRGRRDLTDAVATALLERDRPTLVFYGPRRLGKTSFLLQLPRLLGGNTVPVFVNLQAPTATRNTGSFLYTLVRAIVNDARVHRISLPPVERETFQRGDPFIVFEDWLQDKALPVLAERRLLLTLDEFEKLGQAIEVGRVEEAVLDQLRSLIQHQPQFSLLFAGVATLDELGPHWSSYFINVRALRATYLRPHEAEGLIRDPDPESGFNLSYADAVVDDIIALTRCHPYLVQLLCADVVREANARQAHHATPRLLEAALVRALQSGEPYFRNVWDEMTGTDPASRAAGQGWLRRLAASARPLPIPLEGADVATRRAVDRMTRLDVIEEVAEGYQFQVPFIKRWVIERAPMSLEE